MKQRRAIGRLGGYAEEVAAAVRRRNEKRRPRVRVRVGHGEARVLADESPEGARLQSPLPGDRRRGTEHGPWLTDRQPSCSSPALAERVLARALVARRRLRRALRGAPRELLASSLDDRKVESRPERAWSSAPRCG